jgi:lipoprotein NlpI
MLDLDGWRGDLALYAVLVAHASAQQAGKDGQAKKWLDEGRKRCDTTTWPYPIVKYLQGELDLANLMAAADTNDKMTEARCYVGLQLVQKGSNEAALEHFRWIKEHGNPSFAEFTISLAVLRRLEKVKNQSPTP